jgi:nicotinamidase-related amidase
MNDVSPQKTAIIILDMAKGYGWKPGSYGYEMVARVRKLKDAAHAAGVQVFHVNSMRRLTDGVPNPSMLAGTENLDVIPELQPVDQDITIYKRYLSGFWANDLDYTLRTMGVEQVIIAGASTDNTVLWTSADATQHHYRVAVINDCTMVHRQADPPEMHTWALTIINRVLKGEILSLDEVIAKYLKPR